MPLFPSIVKSANNMLECLSRFQDRSFDYTGGSILNSQIVSDPFINGINATTLIAFGLVALILAFGFRKGSLSQKVTRALFVTIVTAVVALFVYGFCLHHHTSEHDLPFFISAYISYLGIYTAEYMYMRYVIICINSNRNNPIPRTELVIVLVFCMFSALLWTVSTSGEEFIIPEIPDAPYGKFFWIGHAGEWSLVVASILLIIWYHKLFAEKKLFVLFSVPALLAIATLIEPLTDGLCLRYPALVLGLLIVYSRNHFSSGIANSGGEMIGDRSGFSLITNRVKPHFVNNILSTIYYLCDMDLERAKKVAMDLSGYVSGALGAVDIEGLIPFKRELDFIKSYIELEMLRFGDRMTVEYETDELDFEIPPLTIQALVENSVKHGIAEKDSPGSIKLITRRLADGSIQIKVIDDGVGFDTSDPEKTGGELALIRRRIEQEVGGRISVRSSVGSGTTITIKIPHSN